MAKSLFSKGVTVAMLGSVILTLVIISIGGRLDYDSSFYGLNVTAALLMLILAVSMMATGCKSNRHHYKSTMYCNSFFMILMVTLVAAAIIINSINLKSLHRNNQQARMMQEQIVQYLLLCTEVASVIYLMAVAGVAFKRAKGYQHSSNVEDTETSHHCHDNQPPEVLTNNQPWVNYYNYNY